MEQVFRSKDKSQQRALSTLEYGLGRESFYIVSSNDFFWLITAFFAIPMLSVFLWGAIDSFNKNDYEITFGICVFALTYFLGFIFMYRIRRRRRALLPQYMQHFAPDTLTFKEEYLEYVCPYPIFYPLRKGESFGQKIIQVWHYPNIKLVSIFRNKSKKIVSIDIKAGGANVSLNQFGNKEDLAMTFKTFVPQAVIESDHQPILPLWAKIVGITVGIILIGFYFWVMWLAKTSKL